MEFTAQICLPLHIGAKQLLKLVMYVAARAEERKLGKYQYIASHYLFQPVAIETPGVIGPSSLSFLKLLGDCMASESGDSKSTVTPTPEAIYSSTKREL